VTAIPHISSPRCICNACRPDLIEVVRSVSGQVTLTVLPDAAGVRHEIVWRGRQIGFIEQIDSDTWKVERVLTTKNLSREHRFGFVTDKARTRRAALERLVEESIGRKTVKVEHP
jgi:hypothetical protein